MKLTGVLFLITISISNSAPMFGPFTYSRQSKSKANQNANVTGAEYRLKRNKTQGDLMKIYMIIYLTFKI